MDDNDIINMQIANRKLWIDKLSFSGFYYSFTKISEKYFIMSAGFYDLFASLKFVKPLWYFHLDCGEK